MDKLRNNGYTLGNLILVMCIISMSSIWGIVSFKDSYEIYALNCTVEMCTSIVERAKYESYFNRERVSVCFYEEFVDYDGERFYYINGIKSEKKMCFTYNQRGNISKAGTLRLMGSKYYREFVLEIGGGYYEVRDIEAI